MTVSDVKNESNNGRNTSATHDLESFMKSATDFMASEYKRIRNRTSDDPGTAGDEGEENWAALLRDWLPSTYTVVTKGRILTPDGRVSRQVDVLVLKGAYPKKLLEMNTKMFLSTGVAAAFECKTTLKSAHIEKAVRTCVEIKNLYSIRTGTPYKELHSPIMYGLLAHSHSWKSDNSTPVQNIEGKWMKSDYEFAQHPRLALDLICVSDLGVWSPAKFSFIFTPDFNSDPKWKNLDHMKPFFPDSLGTARIAYSGYIPSRDQGRLTYTTIGAFVVRMYNHLAWDDTALRGLAEYFNLSGIGGNGEGAFRHFRIGIYSESLRQQILMGKAQGSNKKWDEWNLVFHA